MILFYFFVSTFLDLVVLTVTAMIWVLEECGESIYSQIVQSML